MTKQTLIAAACAALLLSACSNKEENTTVASSASSASMATDCNHPTVATQVQQIIQQAIATQSQGFINKNDSNGILDSDKLIAIVAQLGINISDVQAGKMPHTCEAQVSINIPENVLAQAKTNAPLLQIEAPVDVITKGIIGSNTKFDNNTLSLPLNYSMQNNQFALTDKNLNGVANLLTDALMAYAVRDLLTINGKEVRREDALRMLTKSAEPKPNTASTPAVVPQIKQVEPIGEQIPTPPADVQMPKEEVVPAESQPAENANVQTQPETLTPPDSKPQSRITDNDLDNARQANDDATQNIKGAWRKIAPEIQKDLVAEQREWESKKRQSCRSAAAKGADTAESRYLQMQCDTRMTRERIEYLNGYSID
ncbi:lysozyme inhibitor LprI family protein [Wielerella bovis]|uniref:lysozyme inhibitor LprI family protein n=1 Tax=Wielerella bovis TaxID=2917790 RepID=UPI0020186741|nr:lysozyme inhibitor LprI family protein [Wielerella bovis]ULJ63410.1 lysozyme inhibitor LprI family protein [Wielerella bovis]